MTNTYDLNLTWGMRAPQEKVFKALSEAEGLQKWWAERAEIDPRKGGEFSLHFRNGFALNGRIISFSRPRSLSYSWIDNSVPTFKLTRIKGGTLLRLTHKGIEEDNQARTACGWSYYLTNLKSVLEHGTDLRSEEDSF